MFANCSYSFVDKQDTVSLFKSGEEASRNVQMGAFQQTVFTKLVKIWADQGLLIAYRSHADIAVTDLTLKINKNHDHFCVAGKYVRKWKSFSLYTINQLEKIFYFILAPYIERKTDEN